MASSFTAFGTAPAAAGTFVYVSNADDGDIDGYALDQASGALTPLGRTPAGPKVMPMTVSPDRRHLYAVVRSEPFAVLTYAIDPASGALRQEATAPLPDSMAYVSTDATGRVLFTASYGGDKVAASPIGADGLVKAEAGQVIPTGRNAHAIRADRSNRFVYATNLGSDQIVQFRFDAATGRLTPNDPPAVEVAAGNGPRHPVLSPDDRHLYVLCELSGNVLHFAVDQDKGTLTLRDSTGTVPPEAGLVPGLPPGAPPATDGKARIWAADLQATPDGRFLYATERTTSRIALLSIDPGTGKPAYVGNYATETQPRGIRVDGSGSWLVATGEKSDRLSVYRIDKADGALTPVGRYPVGRGANWVEIVEVPRRRGGSGDQADGALRRTPDKKAGAASRTRPPRRIRRAIPAGSRCNKDISRRAAGCQLFGISLIEMLMKPGPLTTPS
ncbi:beta-propeller fold lactonase family protein [Inquilinus sp. Marseille-Q2685]|uniref:lactonase family protein n=1 Tax=Inquilinus sp. Marseille-Q2685 TaxID=2866581 RepID=UPI001CE3E81D|nr:beta-propeller fold lactonase family protein [Inquilinus sp. Marseille-Q2685]